MILERENLKKLRENPTQMPLYALQILHEVTQNWGPVMSSKRLTAWAMP
jgi:hypothetical protein